jgi:uncharacterized damage-inducible protein DinB
MNLVSPLISLFAYKAWANDALFAKVAEMDATTHSAEAHNAIRVMNHIYTVDRIFQANLQAQPLLITATNTPETPTLDALHADVKVVDAWYQRYVAKLDDAMLNESINFTFTDAQNGRMTRHEMLLHIITHGGYHRGAVGRILVGAGLTPPRDTLTVFLHSIEPSRREHS